MQVVFCKLSKLQLMLYTHFLESKAVKALLASTLGEDGAGPCRKRKHSKSTAAAEAQDGSGKQQADAPAEPELEQTLAPLTAITGAHAGMPRSCWRAARSAVGL